MYNGCMLIRTSIELVNQALDRVHICYLAGPRQVGKTTLARQLVPFNSSAYFDLEDPASLARLEAPKQALNQAVPLTVIDEIQLRPDLFPILRVLADSPDRKTLVVWAALHRDLKGVASHLHPCRDVELHCLKLEEVVFNNGKLLLIARVFPIMLATNDGNSHGMATQLSINFVSRPAQLGVQIPFPPSRTMAHDGALMAKYGMPPNRRTLDIETTYTA